MAAIAARSHGGIGGESANPRGHLQSTAEGFVLMALVAAGNVVPATAGGLGAAVHDGHLEPDAADRKALGSRVLFHVPLELGYQFDPHNSLSLYFEHISNANTADFNDGMDFLGVRYGYRF